MFLFQTYVQKEQMKPNEQIAVPQTKFLLDQCMKGPSPKPEVEITQMKNTTKFLQKVYDALPAGEVKNELAQIKNLKTNDDALPFLQFNRTVVEKTAENKYNISFSGSAVRYFSIDFSLQGDKVNILKSGEMSVKRGE